MNIYVGNISFQLSEDDLRDIFENYGTVDTVKIVMDRDTGRSKGFGFIEMPNEEEGREAISSANGTDAGGRELKVNEAKPREPRRDNFGGGGGGGGYGGGGGGYGGGGGGSRY